MKYKLLGLYIVFFIIIFLIDNFVVINRIYMGGKTYRLGDSVLFNINGRYSGKYPTGYHLHKHKYSIASNYMRKTDKGKQYDILNNIVKKRTKIRHKLYDNYIIIHLRTGDVMKKNVNDFNKETNNRYVKSLPYYNKVIKYLKKNNIISKNVLIITGWYNGLSDDTKNNSLKYIDEIKNFFKKNGYNVTTRLNEDPDEDFIIMSDSKYFVQSGGGYSRLIGKMVDLNGNTVINEKTLK